MLINNFDKKFLLKSIVIVIIFVFSYFYILPFFVGRIVNSGFVKEYICKKTNIIAEYSQPKLKITLKNNLILRIDNLVIKDKKDKEIFVKSEKLYFKLPVFPLLLGKISPKNINADKFYLNIFRDEQGIYNFEKLFPEKNKKFFSIKLSNCYININSYQINNNDELLNHKAELSGKPFILKNKKKKKTVSVNTKGIYNIENQDTLTDFDIDIITQYPFNINNLNQEKIIGNCFIYNLNLSTFLPYIQKYLNSKISEISGIIDFIQFSAKPNEKKENHIILNSKFNNLVFNMSDWKNYVDAKGNNNFAVDALLYDKSININSLSYKADKVNIKGNGLIYINQKPELDINIEVNKSKTENIASILPPNLVPKYMTIEKVKNYGVYGDIDAKVSVKGKIPQPDITGFITAKNVHVLDKSIHKLHTGTININFDKRILNMDILVDMFDNQKAIVNGYVYMFRDGINNVTIKTTNNIDYPLAQKIIIPVSKVFNFQLGPIPDMNITSGKGEIDVNVKGSIDFVNINGFSSFNNAKLTYNGLYGEIYNIKGRLDFKNDLIYFKSDKAMVKTNPVDVNGVVKINNNLNFNIVSNKAEAKDLLDIINNSSLLKDVKEGVAVITDASGDTRISLNIKSKIVPVPFGHPPLPPEEAFEDMKVKGELYLFGDSCYIEGFKTPIDNLRGIVDFTETDVNLNDIKGTSGISPITISGKIITDIETKIPDVDITVTSNKVYLKDTIKFLTQSYLYPDNYPDISIFYNLDSTHDLYFKYKAKSKDFITQNAYAVMNFINDESNSYLKAVSGKITLNNAIVQVEKIKALFFDSVINIDGKVDKVDTLTPVYNLSITADNFDITHLNNYQKISVLPEKLKNILSQFYDYQGKTSANIQITNNILSGKIEVLKTKFNHIKSKLPIKFDDFNIEFNKDKIFIKDMSAQIEDMPLFMDIFIDNIYTKAGIKAYLTSKITDNIIKDFLPDNISNKINVTGDINFSVKVSGNIDELNIKPILTLHPLADVAIEGINIGDIAEKREFNGDVKLKNNKLLINKIDYIKYIQSQNNTSSPILFAYLNGIVNITPDNLIELEELNLKTNKNISAKILNLILKKPVLQQGTFNCDLKYKLDKFKKTAKILGNIDCRNIDIPLFDTLVKHIKLDAKDEDIDIHLFGFIGDSRININSLLENNLYDKPKIQALKIFADEIDNDKLLTILSKAHTAINSNNEIKNVDFSNIHIENGYLNIKKLVIRSLIADDFTSSFSIDKNGNFKAKEIKLNVGQGNIIGDIDYNLADTKLKGNFELNNVDSNYIAESLFYGKNQIFGNANGKLYIETKGFTNEERIKNLSGFIFFDINDGRMPKLGSLEYLLRASNIIKSGITGFTINSILELLNLIKTGYFSTINGSCIIENGIANNIEIFSKGENLSLYIHGTYDISQTHAEMEILGKLSRKISTIFGSLGNTSLNTFFKLIPGISMLDFGRKDFIEDVEKIPSFTNGDYDARTFQAIIDGNINESGYVQSFKWVK